MIDYDSMKYNGNISNILDKASKLFRDSGLEDLANKWEKILNNYEKARSLR